MPVHRAPTEPGVLEAAVKRIETSEEIVTVVTAGDGAVTIFTRKKPRSSSVKETR